MASPLGSMTTFRSVPGATDKRLSKALSKHDEELVDDAFDAAAHHAAAPAAAAAPQRGRSRAYASKRSGLLRGAQSKAFRSGKSARLKTGSKTFQAKPTFFRRNRGKSAMWDTEDKVDLLRLRLIDAECLGEEQERYPTYRGGHPIEAVLARFLRARKGDLDAAEEMFVAMHEWRRENDIDAIFDDDYPEREAIDRIYPHFFLRQDKTGRPVFYANMGNFDLVKIEKHTTPDRLIRLDLQQKELAIRYHYPTLWQSQGGRVIDQSFVILDLKGFQFSYFSAHAREMMTRAGHNDQNYYPEMLGKAFVINAPSSFRFIWAVAKSIVDERTQNKVTVLGRNFQAVLHKHIDPDNLPPWLGGTDESIAEKGCDVVERYLDRARDDLAKLRAEAVAAQAAPDVPAKPKESDEAAAAAAKLSARVGKLTKTLDDAKADAIAQDARALAAESAVAANGQPPSPAAAAPAPQPQAEAQAGARGIGGALMHAVREPVALLREALTAVMYWMLVQTSAGVVMAMMGVPLFSGVPLALALPTFGPLLESLGLVAAAATV